MRIYVPYIHYIKTLFIKEQNFEVPAASSGPYFNKTLLTVEFHTFAARLTFTMKYGLIYVIYGVIYVLCIILELYEVYIPNFHKICQQSGFIVKTFHLFT